MKVIQSDEDLKSRVQKIIAKKTLGSDMLLNGKMGCKGIVQRLQQEDPETFPTEEAALKWIEEEWGIVRKTEED